MDPVMGPILGLVAACAFAVAPVVVLMGLLNVRDRRGAALLGVVCAQLPGEQLRSDVAIDVRPALLSRRATVRIDLGPFAREELWPAVARLRAALPRAVRLVVDGRLDQRQVARLTIESLGDTRLPRAA